ncbi:MULTISPECIES: TRAP transporter large permease [unclassified Yoonia]|uniref:TRAP transporter large permease n=1 Tax=unclassified Yoonia TaxID=2629118 RepID=UPI002AFF8FB9|nr:MULTISPECIES: TRAP transporter large permease [unclassified Yoonia]
MGTGAVLFLAMIIGAPIGICLCVAAIVFLYSTDNTVLFASYPTQMFDSVGSYGLIAIPLFILVGDLMNEGGITARIVRMAMAFIGSVKGGLAYVNLIANMFVASIMGSAASQVAVMSRVMVPEMERQGYRRDFAAGLTIYAGILGPIVPPSIMFVVYSVLAQISVGDMLLSGIVPGLMIAGSFIVLIAILGLFYPYPVSPPQSMAQRGRAIIDGLPTLLIPLVIVGSIMTGLANPTEAAAVGVLAAFVVGRFWIGDLSFAALPRIFMRAACYSAIILFLVAAAGVFSWVLTYGRVPQQIGAWIQTVAHDPLTFMLLVNVILLFIGTVVDGAPALIMTVPILLPIATEVYGIDPFHFGVVVVLNLVLGFMTPPVGLCLYIGAAVTGVKPLRLFIVTLPFFAVIVTILVLLSVFPVLSTVLSR